MKYYEFEDCGVTFERVSKRFAQRAYNNGSPIVMCPVNLRPGKPWHPEVHVSNQSGEPFQKTVNSFEYYNVVNKETGLYTAFYVRKEKNNEYKRL